MAAGLTPLRRTVTKRYGFRELIHWLRVDERPTRVKYTPFHNICIRVDVALVKRMCLFKASLKGLCHGSPVHFVEFFQLLALALLK